MKFSGRILVALALALSACGQTPQKKTRAPTPALKPIEGFRDIKLASTFESAIALVNPRLFNPYGLKRCFDQLPLHGCSLMRNDDSTVYEMREGIGYSLELSFNRFDKLTDLGLLYHHEGGINGAECRSIFERTLDWVVKDYGPMTFVRKGQKRADAVKDGTLAKSPGGTEYVAGVPGKDGGYVMPFLHRVDQQTLKKIENGKTTVQNLDRDINIFAYYIFVNGRGICDADVTFAEPDTVERAAIAAPESTLD